MRLLLLSVILGSSAPGGASAVDEVREEIVELHQFFEDWFNGRLNEESFERLEQALGPEFVLISPTGATHTREALLAGLRSARGRASGEPMRIEIRDVGIRERAGDRVLATYEEWQWEDGEEKVRISTVLLRDLGDGRWSWLHVHETWIPRARLG